jgi:hypothetical protein
MAQTGQASGFGLIPYGKLASRFSEGGNLPMCRSIHPLFNFDPPATEIEIHAAALQFARKVAGFSRPSQANAAAFEAAVDDIAGVVHRLLGSMSTAAPPRDRVVEAAKARSRMLERYG